MFPRAESTVRPAGELDMAVSPALVEAVRAVLADGGTGPVTVDLAGVTFMDAHALGTLIRLRQDTQAAGRDLRLRNLPAPVSRLLRLTRCTEFPIDRDD